MTINVLLHLSNPFFGHVREREIKKEKKREKKKEPLIYFLRVYNFKGEFCMCSKLRELKGIQGRKCVFFEKKYKVMEIERES